MPIAVPATDCLPRPRNHVRSYSHDSLFHITKQCTKPRQDPESLLNNNNNNNNNKSTCSSSLSSSLSSPPASPTSDPTTTPQAKTQIESSSSLSDIPFPRLDLSQCSRPFPTTTSSTSETATPMASATATTNTPGTASSLTNCNIPQLKLPIIDNENNSTNNSSSGDLASQRRTVITQFPPHRQIRKKSGELVKPSLKSSPRSSPCSPCLSPLTAPSNLPCSPLSYEDGHPSPSPSMDSPSSHFAHFPPNGTVEFGTKSAPTTPFGTPKMVHFDTKLEHVKLFLAQQKPNAVSRDGSPEQTETEEESEGYFPSYLSLRRSSSPMLSSTSSSSSSSSFTAPPSATAVPLKLNMVNFGNCPSSNPVRLDSLELINISGSIGKGIHGLVRVSNIAFEKRVVVRFTLDDWQTVSECSANWKESGDNGQTDIWEFTIKFIHIFNRQPNPKVILVVRYETAGSVFWDNNGGLNYIAKIEKIKNAPSSDKKLHQMSKKKQQKYKDLSVTAITKHEQDRPTEEEEEDDDGYYGLEQHRRVSVPPSLPSSRRNKDKNPSMDRITYFRRELNKLLAGDDKDDEPIRRSRPADGDKTPLAHPAASVFSKRYDLAASLRGRQSPPIPAQNKSNSDPTTTSTVGTAAPTTTTTTTTNSNSNSNSITAAASIISRNSFPAPQPYFAPASSADLPPSMARTEGEFLGTTATRIPSDYIRPIRHSTDTSYYVPDYGYISSTTNDQNNSNTNQNTDNRERCFSFPAPTFHNKEPPSGLNGYFQRYIDAEKVKSSFVDRNEPFHFDTTMPSLVNSSESSSSELSPQNISRPLPDNSFNQEFNNTTKDDVDELKDKVNDFSTSSPTKGHFNIYHDPNNSSANRPPMNSSLFSDFINRYCWAGQKTDATNSFISQTPRDFANHSDSSAANDSFMSSYINPVVPSPSSTGRTTA